MLAEVWREIPVAPGMEVSNLGRVRTFWTRVGAPQRRTIIGRDPLVVTPRVDRYGYESIRVRVDSGVYRRVFIHRLVAEAFVGSIPVGMEINHLDGNKRNNRASNLEITSRRANAQHASRLGLYWCGDRNPMSKLTDAEVESIRSERGVRARILASRFGINESTVRRIWSGDRRSRPHAKSNGGGR